MHGYKITSTIYNIRNIEISIFFLSYGKLVAINFIWLSCFTTSSERKVLVIHGQQSMRLLHLWKLVAVDVGYWTKDLHVRRLEENISFLSSCVLLSDCSRLK